MRTTSPPAIDWRELAAKRAADLAALAAEREISYSIAEVDRIVAVTIVEDAKHGMRFAERLFAGREPA